MSLSDKVVVITGSSRGIGRAIAESALRRGATVVISSRKADACERTLAELAGGGAASAGAGAPLSCFAADVSRYDDVLALKAHALATHGRIDVWFSNAGVSNGYRPLDEEGADELENLIATNILGPIYSAKAMIPHFREHGGYLMNMAGRGWKGDAAPFTTAYAASKAAVASLTRSLADENKDCPRISINAFVPGMVDTDFYVDIKTSPRLESSKGNIRLALDAFGTPLADVGERAATLIAEEPGRTTGRIYPMIGPGKAIAGGAKMAWWGMSGKLKR